MGEIKPSPHADTPGYRTQLITTQQAANTWDDWFWRGNQNGKLYRCPTNNVGACPYTWSGSTSVAIAKSYGGGVSAGGGTNDWFKSAEGALTANFNYTYTKTTTTTDTYTPGAGAKPGQFIEPIWVQQRRYVQGVFQGGWNEVSRKLQSSHGGSSYTVCYDFNPNQRFGAWSANVAIGYPYKSFHIY